MAANRGSFGSPDRPSRGRPKGSIGKKNRELAPAMRDLFNEFSEVHVRDLFDPERVDRFGRTPVPVLALRNDVLEFLAERGWGKAPQKITLGNEDDSPDGILRRLMRERNEKLAKLQEEESGGAATN